MPKSKTSASGSNGSASNGLQTDAMLIASLLDDKELDEMRGASIALRFDVDMETANLMQDAVNVWADGSGGMKAYERGETDDAALAAAVKWFHEYQNLSSEYHGNELIRVLSGAHDYDYKKGGGIYSDGSSTSWTVPSNYDNVMNGFSSEKYTPVVLHLMKPTHGTDIRGDSWLANLDQEIVQKGGYDGTLTVTKVQVKTERSAAFPEGRQVRHVWLKE